jgi:hypothetical protein
MCSCSFPLLRVPWRRWHQWHTCTTACHSYREHLQLAFPAYVAAAAFPISDFGWHNLLRVSLVQQRPVIHSKINLLRQLLSCRRYK